MSEPLSIPERPPENAHFHNSSIKYAGRRPATVAELDGLIGDVAGDFRAQVLRVNGIGGVAADLKVALREYINQLGEIYRKL
ncbi:MAG: hypothetical protein FWE46_04765 [Coriobacteriia bacterium]|nr:hypothetical protein [Coriobacteriia bacterium]MCL2537612.1 hypothetical protein [Coriobacteriia bacterium]